MGLDGRSDDAATLTLPEISTLPSHPLTPHDRLKPAPVVVIYKTTRWEYEMQKLSEDLGREVSEAEVERSLRERGADPASIRKKHDQHRHAVQRLILQLLSLNCSVSSFPSSTRSIPVSSLIIAAGGDGTFLAAASLVLDQTPVVGINTDPDGSEGHLCAGGKNPPTDLLQRALSPDTQWQHRSRIRITTRDCKGVTASLLALNEIFLGEKDSAKVAYYDIAIDEQPSQKQKSSGIVACTGSGSSAWYSSINRIHPSTVASVLSVLRSLGHPVDYDDDDLLARVVAETFNDGLIEEHDSPFIYFAVREPIFNQTFAVSPTKGRAKRIVLQSKSSNAHLVLDGTREYAVDLGTTIELEIDESAALKTLL